MIELNKLYWSKKGTLYRTIMFTNMSSTKDTHIPSITYQRIYDNELWSQPITRFLTKFIMVLLIHNK